MSQPPKQRRKRGVLLTASGLAKLREAIRQAEVNELDAQRYTLESLSDRIGLGPKTITKVLEGQVGLDKGSLARCFQAFDLTLASTDYSRPLAAKPAQPGRADWGEAVDISVFFGRQQELQSLSHCLLQDRCRLVAILGLGGVGKTSLSVKLAKQIRQQPNSDFDWVIWRSLRHGPPLKEILLDVLQVLAPNSEASPLLAVSALSSQLLTQLKQQRCLLVFDNWETVLGGGAGEEIVVAGLPHAEYPDYGAFLRQLCEIEHRSAIVITSREKPAEVATSEGDNLPVRSFPLVGLSTAATVALLQAKGLAVVEAQAEKLRTQYDGNPLGLKMVATAITDIFAGDVQAFLAEDIAIFNGLRILLEQQIQRLSDLEAQVLTWLAIHRIPASLLELRQRLIAAPNMAQLLEALESLRRRSLCVSVPGKPLRFTLQPLVMDYVTGQLTETMARELTDEEVPTPQADLNRYALYLTASPESIQTVQRQRLIQPVVTALLGAGGQSRGAIDSVIARLRQKLEQIQQHFSQVPGYLTGNLLHCLNHLQADLTGINLSGLCVWQADLQKTALHRADFSQADLQGTVFAKTFLPVTAVTAIPQQSDNASLSFATTHFQGLLLIWNMQGEPLAGFQVNASNLWAIAAHPDGTCVASGGDDGQIRLWDLALGQLQQILNVPDSKAAVQALAFCEGGAQLVSGDSEGWLTVWQLTSGEHRRWQAHEKTLWAIAISPDERCIATASDDMTVKLWDRAGKLLNTLTGHESWLRSLAFHPTLPILATASCDHTIRLWDISNPKKSICTPVLTHHQGPVFEIIFTADGKQLISGAGDQKICISDGQTGTLQRTLSGHSGSIYALAFQTLPQGSQALISGGDDAQIRLWSQTTGQLLRTLEAFFEGITGMALCPSPPDDPQNTTQQNTVRLAFASTNGTVNLWHPDTEGVQTLRGHRDRIYGIAVSPDGRTLASASTDHTARLWSTASGQCLRIFKAHTSAVTAVAFHPTQPLLATGSWDCTVHIWNLDTGQIVYSLADQFIQSVAFSPDGELLATGSFDAVIKLWDWQKESAAQSSANPITCPVTRLVGHEKWAWFVSFSPNGKLLASAGGEGICRIWDVATGRCLHVLAEHTDWVMTPAFSPDGTLLATASKDGTARVWSVASGECLKIFPHGENWVGGVVFNLDSTADNSTLWSGSAPLTIRQWDIEQEKCLKTWQGDRLYEGLNITGAKSLSLPQQLMMQTLGASSR